MSTFVSSLINRSFTEQPALRPRAASLFEPTVQADFAHAEAPPSRPAEAPFAGEIDMESEAIPNPGRTAPIRNHRIPQAEHFQDANPAVSLSQQVTQTPPSPARAEDWLQQPVVATVRPHKTSSRTSRERENDSVIESFSFDELVPKSLPARVDASADHEIVLPAEHRHQLVVARQAVPEIVVAPQRPAVQSDGPIQSREQRRGVTASPAMKATTENTVNVTIGTVEVRATTESKPAPRRTPSTSPVMSLEDYLRRRQQGGKR